MKKVVAVIGVLVLVLIVVLLTGGGGERIARYESNKYGFSFAYPAFLDIREYSPQSIAIGHAERERFDSEANANIYSAGGVVYPSYDDFLFDTLRNMCAADGPRETIYCDQIQNRQPFESREGYSGDVLYMRRVHENLSTGVQEVDGWGPIFVFNIAANVPSSQFAVLSIEAPVVLDPEKVDSELIRSIAESVEIDLTQTPEVQTITAIVTDVESFEDQTVVVFDTVEWLDGDEAWQRAAEDTECEIENAEECVASLNNNFYIRNGEEEESRYPVRNDAVITLQEQAQPVESTIGDVDEKLTNIPSGLIFKIDIESDNTISRLEEVYLP